MGAARRVDREHKATLPSGKSPGDHDRGTRWPDAASSAPADVDDDTFTAIVAGALGEDPARVTVLASRACVVPYPLDAITTAGRYWVTARAATPAGERDVRMFVKHVQSWARSPLFRFVPEEARDFAARSVPWRTEPLVYGSDLRDRLPAGLTMPPAHHVSMLDDSSAAIWLPALDVVDDEWEAADHEHAAHLLGRLAACDAAGELTALGDADGGPRTVRTYAEGRLAMQVAPALRSGELWQVPWVEGAFEPELRARLVDALDEVPGWLEELDAVPSANAHGDACRNNLLHTVGSRRHHAHRLRVLEPPGRGLRPRPAARRRRAARPARGRHAAPARRPSACPRTSTACEPRASRWTPRPSPGRTPST